MKRRYGWLPAVAVTLVLLSSVAVALPEPCGKADFPDKMWMELNLSVDQKEQLMALHEAMRPIRARHMESVKAVRERMKTELLKSDPSVNTLYGYAGELGELHKQMSKDRVDHLLKVKNILTPEQFSKLVEREEKMDRAKRFWHRGENHPYKHGGCPHKDGEAEGIGQ